MSSVVAIYRDERFSPNSVKNDRSILDAVLSKLHRHDVVAISEQQLNEQHNGSAHHYPFNVQQLRHTVARLASLTGIDVYGGDCIINSDGRFFIIDFNDWPSFSPCCEQAAECIAHLANQLLATQTTRKITHE